MDEGAPVTELMSTNIRTVTPGTTITEAAETLVEEGIGSLVVVDDVSQPVGMFTTTDLARAVSAGNPATETTVEEYMTEDFYTLDARNGARDAAAKMIGRGVHHLPVVDDEGAVVGMVSTMDITAYLSYRTATDMT
ncbi:CBS domain-containing protein [Salinigranum halophilum]|jgi:CBS domain-containing protein|uniref:CBS domain-containing protein n=1 Tax=Salinigranum halophilum TaxID=2565931 RepID=UPI0010A8C99A|nr:CBS domain-containing protein [Salinigranum halophilum]